MTPGSIVLLHSPLTTLDAWGGLPAVLRSHGHAVVVPAIADDDRPPYAGRYVARAALEIAAADPVPPLVLVAHSGAGPLLPPLAGAQRAAHRPVAGFVFCDAQLPGPGTLSRLAQIERDDPDQGRALATLLDAGGRFPDWPPPPGLEGAIRPRPKDFFTEPLPMPQDWPDAPCGYLRTSGAYARQERQARLRGWPAAVHEAGHFPGHDDPYGTAAELESLIARM
jgi:hypothetical protein